NRITVRTDNILRVKIKALPSGQNQIPGTPAGYTNFNVGYSCVTFDVTVGTETRQTQILHTEGTDPSISCPNAPNYEILEFSERLGSGRPAIDVILSNARDDAFCKVYTACRNNSIPSQVCYWSFPPTYAHTFCPLRTTYKYHVVKGSLEVQVNGSRTLR
ncbi:MAG: hypothetical protein HY072_07325, partial [Deltaproteobacteria bacterium]|nr:hypothetical protein [Deltaproteobacteria bacterium]